MTKKQEKSLKSQIVSQLSENREAIAALATAAATAVAPKIKQKIKDYIEKKQAAPRAHAARPAREKPAPKTKARAAAQPKPAKPKKHAVNAVYSADIAEITKNLPAKISDVRKEPHHNKQTLGDKLANTLMSLAGKAVRNLILAGILSATLFSAGAYFIFACAIAARSYPLWYIVLLGFLIFGISALFGLVYGLFMGLLLTVKNFSADMGHLVKDGANRVKNSIETSVADITDPSRAADIIKNVFTDLNRNIREYAARTATGFLAMSLISGLLFLAKNILTRGVNRIRNKAEFFAALSARYSLILAVILNLKLFAKWALWFGALIGIIAVMLQILIVYWVK